MAFWPFNAPKQKFRASSEERFLDQQRRQRFAKVSESNSAIESDTELTSQEKRKIQHELDEDRKSTLARVIALTAILAICIAFATYLFIAQQVPDRSAIFNEIQLHIQQISLQ